MTESFVAKVKSGQNQSWIVTPQIMNNDGQQHDDITVSVRDGIKPTVGDSVLVNTLKNNLDFSNVNEFYQASRSNGVIIGILMTSGNNLTLDWNYIFKNPIQVNGNSRSLVTYAELNTAIQAMIALLTTSIGTINSNFTALASALATKLDGAGAPGVVSAVPAVSANISAAQTNNIKTGAG